MLRSDTVVQAIFPRALTSRGSEQRAGPRKLAVEALESRHLLSVAALVASPTADGPSPVASAPLEAFPLITYQSAAALPAAGPTAATAQISSPPPNPVLPYLNDEDPNSPPAPVKGAPPIASELFPRVTNTQDTSSNLQIDSKYSTVAFDGARIATAATMKKDFPQTTVLRYFLPRSYESGSSAVNNGMPFTSTGPATNGKGEIYAGAWLYLAGTTTTTPLSATALTVSVRDASRIQAGQYVVIYNGPAGSFIAVEHDKVASVNLANNTITLVARGYKSVASAHPAGAIVAEHDLGSGGNGNSVPPENWAFNLSSSAPKDANGKQFNAVQAAWLAQNLNFNAQGKPDGKFTFDGVIFDGEVGDFLTNPNDDVNNDLTPDAGISSTGTNWYGTGLDTFYADLRSLVGSSKLLVGGTGLVRGLASLNGVQGEGYPNAGTSFVSPPNYSLYDQRLADYTFHAHEGAIGPEYNEVLSKTPTKLYPVLQNGGTPPTSNAPFRLSFGFSLLEDGEYGQDRNGVDPWFDEYSVDVDPGSPTFGQAIPDDPSNEANVRAHEGWLGNPLGPRERLYSPTTFAASATLLNNGGFESGISGWTGSNVTVSQDKKAGDVFDGKASLAISAQKQFNPAVDDSSANSPLIALQANTTYTVAFAVKASTVREISVNLGSTEQSLLVSTDWARHVLTFTVPTAGKYSLQFLVGRESSNVLIDDVYVFKGDADVFQRDFDNGTIFVNATPNPVTIQLSAVYQRIKGTQDPINNGATVSGSITIAAYDSAILIRVGASSVKPAAPDDLSATAVSPNQVDLTWQNLASNESGFVVERKLASGGAYMPVATLTAGVTNYADTGLAAGKSYSYEVLATNSIGSSAPTGSDSATTFAAAAPAVAPNELAAAIALSGPAQQRALGPALPALTLGTVVPGESPTSDNASQLIAVLTARDPNACSSTPAVPAAAKQPQELARNSRLGSI
jgi:hypothetical protein